MDRRYQIAQGDLLLRAIDALPPQAEEVPATNGVHIVAHSETGHHHVVDAIGVRHFRHTGNPLLGYLSVDADATTLRHLRSFDTHAPHTIPKGTYEMRRQREWAPEGWRRVAD